MQFRDLLERIRTGNDIVSSAFERQAYWDKSFEQVEKAYRDWFSMAEPLYTSGNVFAVYTLVDRPVVKYGAKFTESRIPQVDDQHGFIRNLVDDENYDPSLRKFRQTSNFIIFLIFKLNF